MAFTANYQWRKCGGGTTYYVSSKILALSLYHWHNALNQFLNYYHASLVIVTIATATTTTTKKEEQNKDIKKANKIKCKQKTPNGKTKSKGVQSGTGRNHKDRQSNKEDCTRKKF